ncbi:MAG: DNA alkylation repair protein [Roseibium sp.]|uniref:DNA alkylation repair protein n=1 Tax=Roseibium sp. TaxID=1936156 RepID=UPI0026183F7D|nr:DNA alkylation repair protein [Roseibium sp.]MCV0424607.1 DNA alkylation repair protein [Roseibium sp.]
MAKDPAKNWTLESILEELSAQGSEENRVGMARFGIDASSAFGVPMSVLRPFSRQICRSPELAPSLWETGFHEARLLAILLTPPKAMTPELATRWLDDVQSWDLCDQLTNILARRRDSNLQVAQFAADDREFVKRAAFALIAWRAVHAKIAPDSEFLEHLGLIRQAATDERNFVWKAVHWALRQIGKRSQPLHGPALALAEELSSSEDKTSRRVGREAAKELSSEKVRLRLGV